MKKCDKCGGDIEKGQEHAQGEDGKCKTNVDLPHAAEEGKGEDLVHAEAYVRCREVGVPFVKAKKVWTPGTPVSFIWMPASTHQITASYGRGDTNVPIELNIKCDEAGAQRVAKSFEQIRAANPRRPPFICIEHQAKERVGEPLKFEWGKIEHDGGVDEGIVCTCDPSELGARSVNGKNYVSFSPTFDTDADYSALRCSNCAKDREGCGCQNTVFVFGAGARGSKENPAEVTRLDAQSVGSVTNWPAFRSILPVAAREPDGSVKAGAPLGNKNAAGSHSGPNKKQAAWKASSKARDYDERSEDQSGANIDQAGYAAHKDAAAAHKVAADSISDKQSRDFKVHSGRVGFHNDMAFHYNPSSATNASDPTDPEAVHASGTSEGARKGWEHRGLANTASVKAWKSGKWNATPESLTADAHRAAAEAHDAAAKVHDDAAKAYEGEQTGKEAEEHRFMAKVHRRESGKYFDLAEQSLKLKASGEFQTDISVFASLSRLASDPSFAAAREASERADAATVAATAAEKMANEESTNHAALLAHASAHESLTQAVVAANERGDQQAARLLSEEARRHQQAVLGHKPKAGKLSVFARHAANKASVMATFRDRPQPKSVKDVFASFAAAREATKDLKPLPPSREERIEKLFAGRI